ncbi:sulfite exporter TauE/SafE family protein [Nitrosovibrio sp. Nv6]|uniref:sulfite exporter TauE/SafE family protein n=1 Tax=Nitrosovibrio sp. Nv6 TaxID=1855340 RepID=UPI0008B8E183|nr:sulfite exporter TauE/SafE family protein [Nitrosovibrio sp. Nv6]SEP43531.1 hypothetical protein SAMN05216316_3116 [Nitrosovibrio sp. Nv6]
MDIVLLSLLIVVASAVGTVTGFGTSTIMVPVLVPFYGLQITLLLVGIVHWFGDIWKMWLFRKGLRWKLIFQFAAIGIPATVLGAALMFQVEETILSRILGALLIAYVAFLLWKSEFELRQTLWTTLSGGAVYGFAAGIFGIGGAIRGAVLTAYNLPKEVYISTAGAIGLMVDSGRLITYFLGGTSLENHLWWGMLVFIPASFLGAKLGEWIVAHVSQKQFRQVVATFLMLIGLKLLFLP